MSDKIVIFGSKDKKITKLSYTSKDHNTDFAKQINGDGCHAKIQLTENSEAIVIAARLITDIYSFPLFEDIWTYEKNEAKRAIKTFNKIVNVLEDLKIETEDNILPTSSLQGTIREELRDIDMDRKKLLNNRSLEAARREPGVRDWRKSLYGGRYPDPPFNINNKDGIVYFKGKQT